MAEQSLGMSEGLRFPMADADIDMSTHMENLPPADHEREQRHLEFGVVSYGASEAVDYKLRLESSSYPEGRTNQDTTLALTSERYPDCGVFGVADGMGGEKGGAVASKLVADTFRDAFHFSVTFGDPREDSDETLRASLKTALRDSRQVIAQVVAESGNEHLAHMGSTAAFGIIAGDRLAYAIAGDSKVVVVRDGEIVLSTKEQCGDEDETAHMLTNVIDTHPGRGGDVVEVFSLKDGDRIAFMSDGILGDVKADRLDEDDLLEALRNEDRHDANAAAQELLEISKKDDDSSVVVVDVVLGASELPEPPKKQPLKPSPTPPQIPSAAPSIPKRTTLPKPQEPTQTQPVQPSQPPTPPAAGGSLYKRLADAQQAPPRPNAPAAANQAPSQAQVERKQALTDRMNAAEHTYVELSARRRNRTFGFGGRRLKQAREEFVRTRAELLTMENESLKAQGMTDNEILQRTATQSVHEVLRLDQAITALQIQLSGDKRMARMYNLWARHSGHRFGSKEWAKGVVVKGAITGGIGAAVGLSLGLLPVVSSSVAGAGAAGAFATRVTRKIASAKIKKEAGSQMYAQKKHGHFAYDIGSLGPVKLNSLDIVNTVDAQTKQMKVENAKRFGGAIVMGVVAPLAVRKAWQYGSEIVEQRASLPIPSGINKNALDNLDKVPEVNQQEFLQLAPEEQEAYLDLPDETKAWLNTDVASEYFIGVEAVAEHGGYEPWTPEANAYVSDNFSDYVHFARVQELIQQGLSQDEALRILEEESEEADD